MCNFTNRNYVYNSLRIVMIDSRLPSTRIAHAILHAR